MSNHTPPEEESKDTPPFHLRFEIDIDGKDAQLRFYNRVKNLLFDNFLDNEGLLGDAYWNIANKLGKEYQNYNYFDDYANYQFLRCLECIEAAYESLDSPQHKAEFEERLEHIFSLSEIDLGITWANGHFRRSGSTLLDEKLVNDPLGTLSDPRFSPVREPLIKSLTHLLDGERRPECFADSITDCYEALEACAKIVTGRLDKDLSANAELMIAKMPVTDNFKETLKSQLRGYITYANIFRHAKKPNNHRPYPTKAEAEAFVYQTGLFIRLSTSV